MNKFSKRSADKLATCHDDLQMVMNEVIKHIDITILQGIRSKEEQDEFFRTGKSKVQWPNSKHNSTPSMAVDVAPYPIDWNDKRRFDYLAGFVKGVASQMGIEIRHGGDWDSDNDFNDQTFHDLPHFELKD